MSPAWWVVLRAGDALPLEVPNPSAQLFEVRGRSRQLGPLARHQRSPQLIAAVDGARWALWLAPPGDGPLRPTWHELEPHEAVWLAPGTWHRGPIPLAGERGTYLTVQQLHTDTLDHETREPDAA